ncbi:TPA: hypothetical protein ACUNF5_006782 [Burkholderia orbicola]
MESNSKWHEMQRCARELDGLVEYCAEREYLDKKPIPTDVSERVAKLVAQLNDLLASD